MFGKLKTKNVYYGKLCRVTDIEESGWTYNGTTYYNILDKIVFVKKTCIDGYKSGFKVISSGLKIYRDSQDTKYIGDYFLTNIHSLCEVWHKNKVSKAQIKRAEINWNKKD